MLSSLSHPALTSLPLLLLVWLVALTRQSEVSASTSVDIDDEDFPTLVASTCLERSSAQLVGRNNDLSGDQLLQPTLDIRCPTRQMVRIVDLLYGHVEQAAATRSRASRAPVPRCHYKPADCVTHLPSTDLDVPCIGEDRCLVTVPADDRGRLIPGCNRTITYVQAFYQCIPESAVIDLCSPSTLPEADGTLLVTVERQRGFLRTPGYPLTPYPNNVDCEVTVVAPHSFQRIQLDAVDVELEKNGTGCSDWVEIFDGLRSMTLCGRRTRRRLGTSEHHSYRIRFRSNERVQQKGFWIYYEVVPIVRNPVTSFTAKASKSATSGDSSKPSPSSLMVTDRMPDFATSASKLSTSPQYSVVYVSERTIATAAESPLFAESLAGIFIGLFICALVVCLVSIIVIRRRTLCAACPAVCNHQPAHPATSEARSSCYVLRLSADAGHVTDCDSRLLLRLSSTLPETVPDAAPTATVSTLNSSLSGIGGTPKSNAEKLRQRLLLQDQQQRQQRRQQWEQWEANQYGPNIMHPATVDCLNSE